MSSRIYPKDLVDLIKKFKLIPKLVRSSKDIRRYSKYISLQQSNEPFKIEEVIPLDNDVYYQIRFLSTGRQAVVPYEDNFSYYELHQDRSNISKLPTIINTEVPYFGSEIKYWFFINNIDLSSNKFCNFKSLITDSKHYIADNKLYYLLGTYLPLEDRYVDCKAILSK